MTTAGATGWLNNDGSYYIILTSPEAEITTPRDQGPHVRNLLTHKKVA